MLALEGTQTYGVVQYRLRPADTVAFYVYFMTYLSIYLSIYILYI